MNLEKFKVCLEPLSGEIMTFEGWFYNAETQLPFDTPDSYLHQQAQECLKEIHRIWSEKGCLYYWFTQSGNLISDEGSDVISSTAIRINKIKLREYKLSLLGI